MLSIKRIMELMENSEKYSDAEIEKIRDQMRALAEIIFEKWQLDRKKSKENNSE